MEGQAYNCIDSRQFNLYTIDRPQLKNGNVRKAIEDMKVSEMVLPKDLPAASLAAQ